MKIDVNPGDLLWHKASECFAIVNETYYKSDVFLAKLTYDGENSGYFKDMGWIMDDTHFAIVGEDTPQNRLAFQLKHSHES